MITSSTNSKIKYVRRLQAEKRFRYRENAFVVEGTRWISDLVQLGLPPQMLFTTADWAANGDNTALLEQLPVAAAAVSDPLMAMMSATKTAPGVLAVMPIPQLAIPPRPSLLLVLDEVTNPGNLGTMLRSAGAAGADGILLGPGCVDAYNPKVVRGGMGAQLRLPVQQADWEEIEKELVGMQVWLAAADGDHSYTEVDWHLPSAVIIGNEAQGAAAAADRLATGRLSIPMHAATESLNAAVAASIILFEAARQRHHK